MGIYQASSSPLNTRFVHPMTYLYFHLEASVHLNMPNICLVWFPPLLEIYNSLSGPRFIKQHYHSVIQTMKGGILDFSLLLTSLIQTIRESWCVQSSVLSQSPNHNSPSPRKHLFPMRRQQLPLASALAVSLPSLHRAARVTFFCLLNIFQWLSIWLRAKPKVLTVALRLWMIWPATGGPFPPFTLKSFLFL